MQKNKCITGSDFAIGKGSVCTANLSVVQRLERVPPWLNCEHD